MMESNGSSSMESSFDFRNYSDVVEVGGDPDSSTPFDDSRCPSSVSMGSEMLDSAFCIVERRNEQIESSLPHHMVHQNHLNHPSMHSLPIHPYQNGHIHSQMVHQHQNGQQSPPSSPPQSVQPSHLVAATTSAATTWNRDDVTIRSQNGNLPGPNCGTELTVTNQRLFDRDQRQFQQAPPPPHFEQRQQSLDRQTFDHSRPRSFDHDESQFSSISFQTAPFPESNTDQMTTNSSEENVVRRQIPATPNPYRQNALQPQTTNVTHPYSESSHPKVLITYADLEEHGGDTRRNMQVLCKFLSDNGVEPKIDFIDEHATTRSSSDWMETQMQQCQFVIICISSDYNEVIQDRVDPSYGNTKQTTYIYRQLHQEFIENQAKNFRFVPMLIGDGKQCHVPRWLRDTKLYKWPKDWEEIMYRLCKVSRFQKPKLGQPPVCTIRTYGSTS